MPRYIPVFDINSPGAGIQQPAPIITNITPIYSSYTSKLIQYGPIPFNTLNDAPRGHPNYGKPFHVIEYIKSIDTYMSHGIPKPGPRSNNF